LNYRRGRRNGARFFALTRRNRPVTGCNRITSSNFTHLAVVPRKSGDAASRSASADAAIRVMWNKNGSAGVANDERHRL